MKNFKHVIYFLTIIIILHLVFIFSNEFPGKLGLLVIIPFLFGLYHLINSIGSCGRNSLDSKCSFVIFVLFMLLVIKVHYEYYNFLVVLIIIFLFGLFLYKKAWTHRSKQTILSLLILNAILLIVPDSTFLDYFNRNKTTWHKISFSEFIGSRPSNKSDIGAEINTFFNYKINRVYNYPPAIIIAKMNPESSWVLPELKESRETLQHEQFHFDITEYYKRLILDSMYYCWTCNYDRKKSIIDYFGPRMQEMQDVYDTLYSNKDTLNLKKLERLIMNKLK